MGLREKLGGEWWWTNMEVYGEGSVLVSLLRRMGWVNGRILGGVGGNSVVTPDLNREMTPMLDSSMIFGVRIWPLRMHFQFYLILLAQRILMLRFAWNFLEVPFSGT
jgi:hypothetical protein